MASLNLRERLLETTIAYVGAPHSGKSSNLDGLREIVLGEAGAASVVVREDGIACIEWRPTAVASFDDCELSVRIADTPIEHAETVIADCDGIVFVVDSDPRALDANREVARLIQRSAAQRKVAVVVQLNKRDLPDALAEDALVAALEVTNFPRVHASARAGEGVVETARSAVEGVVAMMKQNDVMTRPASEPNPLLAALRQIIETAIAQQLDGIRGEVASLRREIANVEAATHGVSLHVSSELVSLGESIAELRRGLSVVDARVQAAAKNAERACTKDDVVLEAGRHRAAIDGLAHRQRELASAVAGELKKLEQQQRAHFDAHDAKLERAISTTSEGHDTLLAAISPVSVEARRIAARVDAVEARARSVGEDLQALGKRLEETSAKISARVDELIDGLEKRKKSWFG